MSEEAYIRLKCLRLASRCLDRGRDLEDLLDMARTLIAFVYEDDDLEGEEALMQAIKDGEDADERIKSMLNDGGAEAEVIRAEACCIARRNLS